MISPTRRYGDHARELENLGVVAGVGHGYARNAVVAVLDLYALVVDLAGNGRAESGRNLDLVAIGVGHGEG